MDEADRGDQPAAAALFATLYAGLHRLAKREPSCRGASITLSATTLLHEAHLDISARSGPSFPDRARFMWYAPRVMRGLIIDHARIRSGVNRGGQFEITQLGTDLPEQYADEHELKQISDALNQLT